MEVRTRLSLLNRSCKTNSPLLLPLLCLSMCVLLGGLAQGRSVYWLEADGDFKRIDIDDPDADEPQILGELEENNWRSYMKADLERDCVYVRTTYDRLYRKPFDGDLEVVTPVQIELQPGGIYYEQDEGLFYQMTGGYAILSIPPGAVPVTVYRGGILEHVSQPKIYDNSWGEHEQGFIIETGVHLAAYEGWVYWSYRGEIGNEDGIFFERFRADNYQDFVRWKTFGLSDKFEIDSANEKLCWEAHIEGADRLYTSNLDGSLVQGMGIPDDDIAAWTVSEGRIYYVTGSFLLSIRTDGSDFSYEGSLSGAAHVTAVALGPLDLHVVAYPYFDALPSKEDLWQLEDTRDGLVADGVSRFLLKFEVPKDYEESKVSFDLFAENTHPDSDPTVAEVGSLHDPFADMNCESTGSVTMEAQVHSVASGERVAFAVLKAPLDFVRPGVVDDKQRGLSNPRELNIVISSGDTVLGQASLELHRPPVLYLGPPHDWGWNIKDQQDKYSITAGTTNMWALKRMIDYDHQSRQVDDMIKKAQGTMLQRGISTAQVDVIAYSASGNIARIYATNEHGYYLTDENYHKGNMHKLITVNTPHQGSQLASLVVDDTYAVTDFGYFTHNTFGKPGTFALVGDSRANSDRVAQTNQQGVLTPVHTLYSVSSALSPRRLFVSTILTWACGFSISDLFGGTPCDNAVDIDSQRGGLHLISSDFVSQITGSHTDHAGSNGVIHEENANNIVVELLDAQISEKFSTDGFPSFLISEPPVCWCNRQLPQDLPQPLIPVLILAEGANGGNRWDLSEGPLPVQIIPTGEFQPEAIIFVSSVGSYAMAYPPDFTAELDLPPDTVGDIRIAAMGKDVNDVLGISEPLVVSVTVPAELVSLSVSPEAIECHYYASRWQLTVLGDYNDGVTRDITSSSAGTIYVFEDFDVATVDSNGLVTAQGRGQTTITVQNGQIATHVPVSVIDVQQQAILNDWNGDGIISIVGDVPPFVDCVYFQNCPGGIDPIAIGDCNDDGILSIVGDVPCFVDCVYFGTCPD